jgi:hypothetical protein
MLALTVELDEPDRQISQRTGRGERPVDERAAPPLRRDLSPNQNLVISMLKDRFDRGKVLARSDEVTRRASSEQQSYRLDQDRLAGTGLTGEDVQTWLELNVNGVDHGESLDAKEAKHRMGGTPIVA